MLTTETSSKTFYAKWEDGGYPIHIRQTGTEKLYVLEKEEGPLEFKQERALLRALRAKQTRLSSYLGRPLRSRNPSIQDILSWSHPKTEVSFAPIVVPQPPSSPILVGLEAIAGAEAFSQTLRDHAVLPSKSFLDSLEEAAGVSQFTSILIPPPKLGIDLKNRWVEVRKLFFAGFASLVKGSRYDPEEILQEVYMGIHIRNHGKCPWDPRKSTFGHYVHMVIQCVLRNYHRKENNYRTRYVSSPLEESPERYDAFLLSATEDRSNDIFDIAGGRFEYDNMVQLLDHHNAPWSKNAVRVLPLLVSGMTREEMSLRLGMSKGSLSKTIKHIRGFLGTHYQRH